ncbi:hypothetical protein GGD38_004603 [Chitinophagaceae bacterium OAS944]|nr:hypothetical protein [Chitinophagaceae bacterium OAS944]
MVNLYIRSLKVSKYFILKIQFQKDLLIFVLATLISEVSKNGETSNVADAQTLSNGPDSTHYATSSLFISIYYLICLRASLVCLLIFCIYSQSVQLAGFIKIDRSTASVYRCEAGGFSKPV